MTILQMSWCILNNKHQSLNEDLIYQKRKLSCFARLLMNGFFIRMLHHLNKNLALIALFLQLQMISGLQQICFNFFARSTKSIFILSFSENCLGQGMERNADNWQITISGYG